MKRLMMAAALLSAFVLTGCATSRSVVTIAGPADVAANPASGPAVKIVRVEDQRVFEAAPRSPSTPSLSDGNINDRATTTRAIARKRNTYGMALGDVLLPEGQSVAALVGNAVASGFRKDGYRVLSAGDPGYDQAAEVDVSVSKFWSWFDPGFASVSLSNDGEVHLTGTLPALSAGLTVQGNAHASMMMVVESDWQSIVTKGLTSIADGVANALAKPGSSPTS